jgi:hypothetical protein
MSDLTIDIEEVAQNSLRKSPKSLNFGLAPFSLIE